MKAILNSRLLEWIKANRVRLQYKSSIATDMSRNIKRINKILRSIINLPKKKQPTSLRRKKLLKLELMKSRRRDKSCLNKQINQQRLIWKQRRRSEKQLNWLLKHKGRVLKNTVSSSNQSQRSGSRNSKSLSKRKLLPRRQRRKLSKPERQNWPRKQGSSMKLSSAKSLKKKKERRLRMSSRKLSK